MPDLTESQTLRVEKPLPLAQVRENIRRLHYRRRAGYACIPCHSAARGTLQDGANPTCIAHTEGRLDQERNRQLLAAGRRRAPFRSAVPTRVALTRRSLILQPLSDHLAFAILDSFGARRWADMAAWQPPQSLTTTRSRENLGLAPVGRNGCC